MCLLSYDRNSITRAYPSGQELEMWDVRLLILKKNAVEKTCEWKMMKTPQEFEKLAQHKRNSLTTIQLNMMATVTRIFWYICLYTWHIQEQIIYHAYGSYNLIDTRIVSMVCHGPSMPWRAGTGQIFDKAEMKGLETRERRSWLGWTLKPRSNKVHEIKEKSEPLIIAK